MNDLQRLWDKAVQAGHDRRYISGRLGKADSSGLVTMLVDGRPNHLYVSLGPEGDQGVTIAMNVGAPRIPWAPIRLKRENNQLYIEGLDYTPGRLEAFFANQTAPGNVGFHNHRIGSGLEYELEALRLEVARVYPTTGLTVGVKSFRYYYRGAWDTWEAGSTIDLTPYKPATDKWAWVLVGVDPDSNSLVAAKSADQDAQEDLTVDLIDGISFSDYIPCAAVQLAESDTSVANLSRWHDAHGWFGSYKHTHEPDEVWINVAESPTRDTLEDFIDTQGSKDDIEGGAVSDAGGGTVDVTAGEGYMRATDDVTDTLVLVEWAAANGLTIPSDSERWIEVDYNSGAPVVQVATTENDGEDKILLARVYNEGGTLHLTDRRHTVAGGTHNIHHMLEEVFAIRRAELVGGLILGETGTRNVTVSSGELYLGAVEYAISAIDTSGADTFDAYYSDGGGGFTKVASQSQWDNDSYDDGSGSLATMTNNRYGVLWFYLELDGDLVCLYGTSNAPLLATAEAEAPPTTVPTRLSEHAMLIGRIVYQKSASTAEEIQTVFVPGFVAGAAGAVVSGVSVGEAVALQIAGATTSLAAAYNEGLIDIQPVTPGSDDTLTTINGGSEGQVIVLFVSDPSTNGSVTVSSGGNINVSDDVELDTAGDALALVYTDVGWCPIGGGGSGGGGASAFLDLTDTPSSFSGQASKYAVVNSGETALEFAAPGLTTTAYHYIADSAAFEVVGPSSSAYASKGDIIIPDTTLWIRGMQFAGDVSEEDTLVAKICTDDGSGNIDEVIATSSAYTADDDIDDVKIWLYFNEDVELTAGTKYYAFICWTNAPSGTSALSIYSDTRVLAFPNQFGQDGYARVESVDPVATDVVNQATSGTPFAIGYMFRTENTPEIAGMVVSADLDDLDDVAIDGTPADNDILAYDTTSSKWINQTAAEAGITSGRQNIGTPQEITLSSGEATLSSYSSKAFFNLRGEGGSADDLTTITDSGATAGDVIYLTASTEAITVVDHGDNIICDSGDRVLDSISDTLVLRYNGTDWIEMAYFSWA